MLTWLLLVLATVAFVLILLTMYWCYVNYNYFFKMKNLPGPSPLPILGNALYFKELDGFLNTLLKLKSKYGSPFKITIGFQYPWVIISDSKFMTFFLSSNKYITKSQDYNFFRSWLGDGLLTSTETALRTEINAQIDNNSDYVRSVQLLNRILMDRALSLFLWHDSIYMHSDHSIRERSAVKIINSLTDSVIKRRKEEIENQWDSHVEDSGDERKLAFLDLLLQAEADGERLSDISIRDEVNTFMFEGHDTTASAISFSLYNISQHPEVQKKIVEELNTISNKGNNSGHFTYTDLQEMKYLEAVIKETLRMYPPVPLFGRLATEDILYEDKVIPKDTNITLFAFGLLRDPELFPEPEKFLPERFLGNKVKANNPFTYVPFSAGPRNCIGQKFAMLEMKSTIGHILKRYELHPADGNFQLNLISEVILKSTTGIKLRIKRRL
ncbi:cytochrome P450 4d2-like isoform X3 [Agrilus planipennis]|uniref:Cytochrome P450 4d2-like isoform X3 n=1 Tax=Agrilus planipennis TaxID=224129 RepID=A0A7F5RB28_AGRPL|nr:cytochrome P450 4d2-like isoform X3 [Agrilus planipennis]